MADVEVFEIDDDFDPLEDIAFDADSQDDDARPDTDYQIPIPDADKSVLPEKRELDPSERIAKLMKGMPGQGPRLLRAIELSREEIDARDLAAALDLDFPREVGVYGSNQIIRLLEEAGALSVRIEQVDSERSESEAADFGMDAACVCESDVVGEEFGDVFDEATERTDMPVDAGRVGEAGISESGTAYRVPAPEAACWYKATHEGLAALEMRGGLSAVRAALLEEPRYLPLFERILDMTSSEGGASMKELDAAVNVDPLCAEPRRFCGYFLGKLERLGAVRFEGSWVVTSLGREALASDLFVE